MSEEIEVKESAPLETPAGEVEVTAKIEEVENPRLEKAYGLFAEFHGSLDETYTDEQRIAKLKELQSELNSIVGYADDSEKIKEESDKLKSEYEAKLKENEDLNKKLMASREEVKILKRIEKEYKAARVGPLVKEESLELAETAQETYNRLLATDPIQASQWYNKYIKGK